MFGYNHENPFAFDINAIPAVFGAPVEGTVSKRYEAIPTAKIVDLMGDLGWKPVAGNQIKPRKKVSSADTVKHAVVFQQYEAKENDNGVTGQIVLVNSHDSLSSYRLYYGLYRFVCANGLMVGDEFAQAKIRHMGRDAVFANIEEATKSFVLHSEEVNAKIDDWRNIRLGYGTQIAFAKEAAILRFGEAKAGWFKPGDFLAARNSEDKHGDSLWNTYNKVQENLVKGGIKGRSPKRSVSLRGLNGLGSIAFNQNLWNLAETYAEAA